MTSTVTYVTKSGATVKVSLVTERPNMADHNAPAIPCWDLVAAVNSDIPFTASREDHPVAGPAIRIGNKVAAIPADKLAEVDALVAEYAAGVEARRAQHLEAAKAEAEHIRFTRHVSNDGLPAGGAR